MQKKETPISFRLDSVLINSMAHKSSDEYMAAWFIARRREQSIIFESRRMSLFLLLDNYSASSCRPEWIYYMHMQYIAAHTMNAHTEAET